MTKADEHAEKVARARAWLIRTEHDGALLTSQGGFAWVTAGGEAHVSLGDSRAVGAILVTADRVALLTNPIEERRLWDEELAGLPLETAVWPWHDSAGLERTVTRLAGSTRVATDVPSVAGLPYDAGLARLRYTLLPAEVTRYRQLGREAAEVVEDVCRSVEPGQTEQQLAAAMAAGCARRGIVPLVNLVAADERIRRYRHPLPTRARVRSLAMLVLTGRRAGLHVSLTRLVAFGSVEPDTQRRHRAVVGVDAAYIASSCPGQDLSTVFRHGLRAYEALGFGDEWERHHQGGLTGYAGREILATPAASHVLEANQALAWNPSITGTKSEDTVLVTAAGAEVLSSTGAWPALQVISGGRTILRPDILVR